jgi:hypothetical protein
LPAASSPAGVSVASVASVTTSPVALSIVLPPADAIEPSELARVRLLVERALGEVGPLGGDVEILSPRDGTAQLGIIEVAARRSSNVCVLGGAALPVVEGVRQVYPAMRGCLLTAVWTDAGIATALGGGVATSDPANPAISTSTTIERADERLLRAEVDLWTLGAELGRNARAVAGDDLVVVLAGNDPMLARSWVMSVASGARSGPVTTVHDARAVPDLIELLGPRPTSPVPAGAPSARPTRFGDLDRVGLTDELIELLEVRDLRVGAVVLDASAGAAELAARLLEQGVPVIGPRSILADDGDHPALIARWRVRWDVPLATLLRALANGGPVPSVPSGPAASTDPIAIIEPGPALRAVAADR